MASHKAKGANTAGGPAPHVVEREETGREAVPQAVSIQAGGICDHDEFDSTVHYNIGAP